jgi:CheY-like chemotaxis protein
VSVSFTAQAFARLADDLRCVEQQAALNERDAEAILLTAESDVRLAMRPLAHPREITAECVAQFEMAALAQLRRCEAAVGKARRLHADAREHRLAAHQLVVDFSAGSEAPAPAPAPDRRRAVLVVDDYADAREPVAAALRDAGFIVRTARNGVEAIIAACEMRPVVIVMDMTMPVLDGMEATRVIKTIDASREARVIAYTAAPMPQRPQIDALFAAVLQKPAPLDVVLATVRLLAAA